MPKLKLRLSTVFLLIAVFASLMLAWLNHRRAERLASQLELAEERLANAEQAFSAMQTALPLYDDVQRRFNEMFIIGSQHSVEFSHEPQGQLSHSSSSPPKCKSP